MRFFKQIALLALMVGVGVNLTACQPGDSKAKNQPSLVSIKVSPESATVMLSSTQALKVMGTFDNNSSLDVTSASSFASSATSVALVEQRGRGHGGQGRHRDDHRHAQRRRATNGDGNDHRPRGGTRVHRRDADGAHRGARRHAAADGHRDL